MDDENDPKSYYLDEDELKKELFNYSEKNNIPREIIDKTYNKIKEKNVRVTYSQLKLLISRITKEIQNQKIDKNNEKKDSPSESTFLDILKNIESRLFKLEKYYSNICEYSDNITNLNRNKNLQGNKKNNMDIVKLNEIPLDAQSTVILMKWLQYLIDKLGKSQISDVLNFYVDIGWITEDIKFVLLKYVQGLTDKKKDDSQEQNKKITSKEHIHSLLFIQKLKGKDMDDFLWKIDQDLEKFFKNIENHYPDQI